MTGNERVQKVNVCLWAFLLYLFRVVNTPAPLGCPCAFHLRPAAIIIGVSSASFIIAHHHRPSLSHHRPSLACLSHVPPTTASCRICVTKTLPIYGLPLANPFIYRPSRMVVVIHGGFKPSHFVLFMSFLWDLCPFSEGFPLLWTRTPFGIIWQPYLHILTAFNRLLILFCSASVRIMPDFAPKIGVFR